MTSDEVTMHPVQVEVKNYSDLVAKPKLIQKTTLRTLLVDPAGVVGQKNIQICDYEPKRVRLAIQVVDFTVVISAEPPAVSPDVSATPQGKRLASTTNFEYEFFGPDAFWINSTDGIAKVSITKEYC